MDASILPLCLGLLAVSALLHLVPRFTRPDLFFGVTVDPSFGLTDEARRIVRNHRLLLWSSAAAANAIVLMLRRPALAIGVYVIGVLAAQALANRRASAHATVRASMIEVDLSAPIERLPGGVAVALLPFALLFILGAWATTHVNRLPDRLATHWAFGGPDRWSTTSQRAIVELLAQHAFTCLVLAGAALAVLYWSRRVSTSGPAAATERQFRRNALLLLLSCEYMTALPPLFTLLQAPTWVMQFWGVALLALLLIFVANLLRVGQGGTRMAATSVAPIGDRTADSCWTWGFVYVNRADPAVLVEKRTGIGWTLNFGNPWSWVILAAIMATPPLLHHVIR